MRPSLLEEFVALIGAHQSRPARPWITHGPKDPLQMSNALAPLPSKAKTPDSWDTAGDEISPVRGPNIKFDASAYYTGKEKTPIDSERKFIVIDRAEGWQFLKKDCPAEWLMRKSGEPKPEQPFADESTWPMGLDGKPQSPWKYTLFAYLLDAATGESLTFSSSTSGGRIAVDELTAQIRYMRNMQPGAVPIVTLDSRQMNTKFGKKPRPFFKIAGWKVRDAMAEDQPRLIVDNSAGATKETNTFNDDIPW
jgi:hypothetical protein